MVDSPPTPTPATQRKGSMLATLKAVAWSFFGIRKKSAYQDDLAKLNPLHIIAVAFVMVIAFIVGLVLVVRFVVAP